MVALFPGPYPTFIHFPLFCATSKGSMGLGTKDTVKFLFLVSVWVNFLYYKWYKAWMWAWEQTEGQS